MISEIGQEYSATYVHLCWSTSASSKSPGAGHRLKAKGQAPWSGELACLAGINHCT